MRRSTGTTALFALAIVLTSLASFRLSRAAAGDCGQDPPIILHPRMATCPEFNGSPLTPSEVPQLVFTDTITFDPSEVVGKNHAIMTGSFGNTDGGANEAHADILIGSSPDDAILLRQCTNLAVCSVSSWRVDINDLSFLTEVSDAPSFVTSLFGVQTSAGTLHIGETALTLTTVPEPGTLPLLGSALVIAGLRRRCRSYPRVLQ